jgi:hypothetical protein
MLLLMVELENEGRVMTDKMLITVMGSDDRGLVYQVDTSISILDAIKWVHAVGLLWDGCCG